MRVCHIEEPLLEFGAGTHIDVRFGIAQHGPFDVRHGTAPESIRVGVVGSTASIEELKGWLERAAGGVSGKASRRANYHPAFPGFSEESCFGCRLVTEERWTGSVSQREVDALISQPPSTVVSSAVDLFVERARRLLDDNALDVLICAPPGDLMERLDNAVTNVAAGGDKGIDEGGEEELVHQRGSPPFHDLLKARGMALGVPLQMVRPPTYGGNARRKGTARRGLALQDEATRAWNFFTALYYKAGGIPWRLLRDPASFASCYTGISFFRSLDGEQVLTSVAQVFDERGQGIIVRGANAQKTEVDRQPHLNDEDAYRLVGEAIKTFREEHRHMPARLVVHKTSKFAAGEQAGVLKAATDMNVELVDLVTVERSFTRLFRTDINPPLRGTLLDLSADKAILYLRGSVEFFEMYPGMYVPRPVEMTIAKSELTKTGLAAEMLALSKLNWNNTQFDGGEPITVRAARQVGDILKCAPSDPDALQRGFRFYM